MSAGTMTAPRRSTRTRASRLLRGGAAASVATFVALLSHVSAGGSMPGWLGLFVPWILSMAVCVILSGRRLSLVRLSVGVVVSQFLFHLLFSVGSYSASDGAATGVHAAHAGMMLSPGATSHEAFSASALMWAAHIFAAIVTTAALFHGERAVLLLTTVGASLRLWVRRIVRTAIAAVQQSGAVVVRGAVDTLGRCLEPARALVDVVIRRGPPALSHS